MCASFHNYKELLETVPLNFSENDVMWVASKLAGDAGSLGEEEIDMINWLI